MALWSRSGLEDGFDRIMAKCGFQSPHFSSAQLCRENNVYWSIYCSMPRVIMQIKDQNFEMNLSISRVSLDKKIDSKLNKIKD
jgi:hypothetical protein